MAHNLDTWKSWEAASKTGGSICLRIPSSTFSARFPSICVLILKHIHPVSPPTTLQSGLLTHALAQCLLYRTQGPEISVYQEAWSMVHKRWRNLYRCLKTTVRSGPSKPDAERWQRKATRRSKCSEHWRAELRNSSDPGDSQPLANQAPSLLQFHTDDWRRRSGQRRMLQSA